MPEAEDRLCYEFGGYRLDAYRRRLVAVGQSRAVRLPPRVFDTLVYLVERSGELIDKATLLDAIWPEMTADENSLNQNISILRRTLGESPSEHRYILTVPGRGYRFVADVRRVEASTDDAAVLVSAEPLDESAAESADAPHLYAQARGLSAIPTENNLRGALTLLTQATTLDPRMARAWSLMAAVYGSCVEYDYSIDHALAQAEGAAQRAIALDSRDGSSFAALGIVRALRGRWVESEAQFRHAVTLTASDPFVKYLRIVHVTHAVGHFNDALEQAREAYRFAPARQFGATMLALAHLIRGEDDEALRWADHGVALGESITMTPQADMRAQLAFRAGRYSDAAALLIPACSQAMRSAGGPDAIELTCAALRDASLRSRALSTLRALEDRLAPRELDQTTRKRLLLWYTMLGDVDTAYGLMDRSLTYYAQRGFVGSAWSLLWMSELRPFRQDPRFQDFCRRLGLFEYWEAHGAPDGHELREGRVVPLAGPARM